MKLSQMLNHNTIQTGTPNEKPIGQQKYAMVRDFIVGFLRVRLESTFSQLLGECQEQLAGKFHEGELCYLLIKVKNDLEAKGVIYKRWHPGRVQVVVLKRKFLKNNFDYLFIDY
jgi:hypothetical protein